jgi:alpha-mannosidase
VVRFDPAGKIISFVDKASGRELVKAGGALNSLLIGEDVPEAWDNWDIDSDQQLKMAVVDQLMSREVVSNGPLQTRIRSEYKIGDNSYIKQDMVFHTDTPQVDFETVIDWNEKHKLLKAGFEFDILTDYARHEIQYGHAERPTHRNLSQDRARFEVAAHKWSDLSDNGFGVALLNDCKYGLSVYGGELRLTLMKSGVHPDPRGDAGRHLVTYSLLPHACGFSVESVVRPAYELNVPPMVFEVGDGVTDIAGLLTVDAPNVIVESIKWAEKGNAFVVRLYEAGKIGCSAGIGFNIPVRSVKETNMLEEKPVDVELVDGWAELSFRALEIKTLYCEV